jgi:hypothetical protein
MHSEAGAAGLTVMLGEGIRVGRRWLLRIIEIDEISTASGSAASSSRRRQFEDIT